MNRLGNWMVIALAVVVLSTAGNTVVGQAGSVSETAFEAASRLYQEEKWQEAFNAFQDFEKKQKFSTLLHEAVYYQGWCLYNLGKYQDALKTFDRLAEKYSGSGFLPEATLKKAECYREMKDFPKAIEQYQEFEKKYADHELVPQAMLGEAWMNYRQWMQAAEKKQPGDPKNLEAAKAICRKVLDKYGSDEGVVLDGIFLLGQVYTEEKNYEAAREIYSQIAKRRRNPRAAASLFLAGEAMFESAKHETDPALKARRYYEAIPFYKRIEAKVALLAHLKAEIDARQTRLAKILSNQMAGNAALERTAIQQARQLMEQVNKQEDVRPLALMRIANCYEFLNRPEEAAVVYRYLMGVYPNHKLIEQVHASLIQALSTAGRSVQANAEAEDFKKKHPKSDVIDYITLRQADARLDTEDFQEALTLYQKAKAGSKDPKFAEAADFGVAACYQGMEQYDKARDSLEGFIKSYPASQIGEQAVFRLALVYFKLAQKAEAANDTKAMQDDLASSVKQYEFFLTKYSESKNLLSKVYFQLGYVAGLMGGVDKANFEKSLNAFRKFVEREPKDPLVGEATYQIGRDLFALGRYDEAIASYQKLLESEPNHAQAANAAFETASAYHAKKDAANKVTALRFFIEKFPDDPRIGDAMYVIGAEFENQKKPDDAITEYRNLIARAASAKDQAPVGLINAAIAGQMRITTILEGRSEFDKASAECEKFLTQFANQPTAARLMVSQIASLARSAKQKSADIAAKMQQLVNQYPQVAAVRVQALTSIIELWLAEDNLDQANVAAQKLLTDPDRDHFPEGTRVAIGNTLLRRKDCDKAREFFDKVLASEAGSDPRTATPALLGLGKAYLCLEKYQEAETALTKMLELTKDDQQNPLRSEAELAMGITYESTKRFDEAMKKYDALWRGARGKIGTEAAFRAGRILFDQKKYREALPMFLRVMLSAGEMGDDATFYVAECHYNNSKQAPTDQERLAAEQAARSAYKAYLARFKEGKHRKEAEDRVNALPPLQQP